MCLVVCIVFVCTRSGNWVGWGGHFGSKKIWIILGLDHFRNRSFGFDTWVIRVQVILGPNCWVLKSNQFKFGSFCVSLLGSSGLGCWLFLVKSGWIQVWISFSSSSMHHINGAQLLVQLFFFCSSCYWSMSLLWSLYLFFIYIYICFLLPGMRRINCYWVSGEQVVLRLLCLLLFCQVIACTLVFLLQQLMRLQLIAVLLYFITQGQLHNTNWKRLILLQHKTCSFTVAWLQG